ACDGLIGISSFHYHRGGAMPDRDTFKEWERSREEEYFHKKEHELIEKMHLRAQAEAERTKMAEASGITDDEVLSELQETGYTHETVTLAWLVQLAWVDGGLTSLEREEILEMARLRGVAEASPADEKLAEWMETRPTDQFFQRNLQLLRSMLRSMSSGQREVTKREMLAGCHTVAGVSGGVLGIGHKLSREEHALIDRIAAALE